MPTRCLLSRLILAAAAAAACAPAFADKALASRHGCLGCHAADTRLVGPSYREVAAKYAGQADAAAGLAKRIRAGGSGVWGDMAMPPQPKLSEADARKLAAWILAGAR
jgi:cytochrome c